MATEFERFRDDAQSHGLDPKMVTDATSTDRTQRVYLALKLFQMVELLQQQRQSRAK